MDKINISRERSNLAVGLVGGPTMVIDYGGLRLVTDPTFDAPSSPDGRLVKLEGPAVTADVVGTADAVLLSHEAHFDNFDLSGRDYAAEAGRTITGLHAAERVKGNVTGLEPWQTAELTRPTGEKVTITAVPADHGPADGLRDEWDNINCEVVGFVVTSTGLPSIYVSGDNASIERVREVASAFPQIDIAILFTGAARVDFKEQGRPLTLTAERAADAALILGSPRIVPAHFRGWNHFSQGPDDMISAFEDAGIRERLQVPEPGVWTVRDPA